MTLALRVFGILLAVIGMIWILQGINVLPGSFMTGQIKWAGFGSVALLAGCVLLWWAHRRRTLP